MQKYKRCLKLTFSAAVVIVVCLLICGCFAADNQPRGAKSGDVVINSDNFPDEVFRSWLMSSENIGGAGVDGILTADEINSVTEIVVERNGGPFITSLQGIENFKNLTTLSVTDNGLTSLDLRQNTQLRYVNCMYNRLTDLYVSGLTGLETLFCEHNYLETLDLSGDVSLKTLYSRHNLLKSLDLSDNTELVFVETFDNLIEEIDVSMLSKLEFLHIDHNKLTTLDMSHNLALKGGGFVARNNDLRQLKLPVIEGFTIYYDDFAEQDPIEGYERLQWFADSSFIEPVTTDVEAQGQTLYGKRLANRFTVNFDGNGTTDVPQSVSGEYGSEIEIPSHIPLRRGYIFKGWCKDKIGTSDLYQPSEMILNLGGKRLDGEKVTLFAQWNPVSYKVRFDGTEGVGAMPEMSVRYGQSFNLSSNEFSRQGYDFVGWATSIGGPAIYRDGQTVSDLSYTDGDTVVLYAVWERDAQSVRQPYEQQITKLYQGIERNDYLYQDLDSIDQQYALSLQQLVQANKSESLMKNILSDTQQHFQSVLTRQQRVDEITSRWQQNNITSLQIVGTKPLNLQDIYSSLQTVKNSVNQLNADTLSNYSTLTHQQSLWEAVDIAVTQLQSVKQSLLQFVDIAEWISSVKQSALLPLSQVKSDSVIHYTELSNQLTDFPQQQADYVPTELQDGIRLRIALSESKQLSIERLAEQFSKYNESDYHPEQWRKVVELYNQGVENIENSTSESENASIVLQSTSSMDEVPFQPLIPPQPQPPVDEPVNNAVVVWIVSLCMVVAFVIVVLVIVRKSRRNR